MSWSREPKPVPVRRYRYSKLRWRVLVHVLDAVGTLAVWMWRWLRAAPVVSDPRRILVVQLDHLGDSVLSSPIFPALREAYPKARIDVLASSSNRAVFEADAHVENVIVADRNWFERRPKAWALGSAVWSLGRSLRSGSYDLGIDVRGDVLSTLVLALAGIPRRLGWAMGGGAFLLTDVADWVPARHEVRSRLALLERLDINTATSTRVSVQVTDADRARVRRMLREAWADSSIKPARKRRRARVRSPRGHAEITVKRDARPSSASPNSGDSRSFSADGDLLHAGRFEFDPPLLVAHLGAGTLAKRWPPRHWRTLLSRFLSEGWRVVVVGGPVDADAAEALEPHPRLRDWTGRLEVTQTAALLERAELFIGGDSGPAHLAACAGVPSVILFSGTNRVAQWRPWSRRSLVLRKRVPCRPCHHKVCPLADHPCLAGISPDRVYTAARRWLARLHRSEGAHASR